MLTWQGNGHDWDTRIALRERYKPEIRGFPDDHLCEHPRDVDLYIGPRLWQDIWAGIRAGLAVVGAAALIIWWLT